MAHIGCTIKQVPPDKVVESASKAVELNPANAPNTSSLPHGFTPTPDGDLRSLATAQFDDVRPSK